MIPQRFRPQSGFFGVILLCTWLVLSFSSLGHAQYMYIEQPRKALFARYQSGQSTFETMMTQARDLEEFVRGRFMKQLGVKDAGYARQPGEEDIPVRTGSTPASANGRGIFSDEDIRCETRACVEQIIRITRQQGLALEERRFVVVIPAVDTKVWRPEDRIPPFEDRAAYDEYVRAAAQEPEYALGARYGVVSSQPALETVLENLTKGHLGFSQPPAQWGNGYLLYETLIQAAKNTVRSLEATGLCTTQNAPCAMLNDLRKMRKSPEALGLFPPHASDAEMTVAAEKQQHVMNAWMGRAFESARMQLDAVIQEVAAGICISTPGAALDSTRQVEVLRLQESLYRIAVRYNTLWEEYPGMMQAITGEDSPYPFICKRMRQIHLLGLKLQNPRACGCLKTPSGLGISP